MQRVVGGYLAKRIGDELFSPPAQPVEATPTPDGDGEGDAQDRLALSDERGRPLGTAFRLPGVAIYVVSDGHGYRQDELEWGLKDPSSRIFVQRDGGRITGLVYAPARKRPRRRVEALRADEV